MANPNTSNGLWRWLRAKSPLGGDPEKGKAASPPSMTSRRTIDKQENSCGVSDVGSARDGNEDMFLLAPDRGLFVVADGLGGHAAGEVASALIVRTVFQTVEDRLTGASLPPTTILADAFREADDAVRAYTEEHPECRGMGATLVVALIVGNQAVIGHAGDTRAYLSHEGVLRRLTNDHTAVGRLLSANLLTEDEARGHPARNAVSQAVMGARDVTPEFTEVALETGDRLMLCSDGLWDEVSHEIIEKILADDVPAWEMATRLVDRAIIAGGNDNITAVVYRHRPSDAPLANAAEEAIVPNPVEEPREEP